MVRGLDKIVPLDVITVIISASGQYNLSMF